MSAFANCVNRLDYFTTMGAPVNATLIEATGLEDPFTGGGIEYPRPVAIPANTVLLRCYKNTQNKLSSWWNTPREIHLLMEYSGRSGKAFHAGRFERGDKANNLKQEKGKGYMHAMNGVLFEWNSMAYVVAIRTKRPFVAYYGEGRTVQGDNHRIKPARIWDKNARKQRCLRQIFLKNIGKYEPRDVEVISRSRSRAVADLEALVRSHKSQKLIYE